MNRMNKSYGIVTTVVGLDIISAITVEGPDIQETVTRRLIRTQDEHVRKALIELGWTPPPAATSPSYEQAEGRMHRAGQNEPVHRHIISMSPEDIGKEHKNEN